MTMTTDDDTLLDQAFAELTADTIAPSEGLMDRIMLDADQVLTAGVPAFAAPVSTPQGFGAALLDAIGGWMSFGGLSAAGVMGLWIGVSPPDVLYDYSADIWGDTIEVPLLESDIFAGLDG